MTSSSLHDELALIEVDPDRVEVAGEPRTPARRIWAATRIGIGLVFLWAFFDKLFALGFATGRLEDGSVDYFGPGAWINGGSPTFGFLEFGTKGPFEGAFQSFAGAAWADWLFMIGLLAIGVALALGISVRIAAVTGGLMLMLMWLAVLPPEHHPVLDDHVIYTLVLAGLAYSNTGRTWGLGQQWERKDIVRRYPILR